jgi:hypothetical protein
MALTDRLGLRLLRAEDAVALREVTQDSWVEDLAARTGDRTLSPWAIVLRDGGAIERSDGLDRGPWEAQCDGPAITQGRVG